VIDQETRALVSVLEAVEHVCRGRRTILVRGSQQARSQLLPLSAKLQVVKKD